MSIFKTMNADERSAFFNSENVKKFFSDLRSVSGAELTIPEEFIGLITEHLDEYSKLYKHLTVKTMNGNGRVVVTDIVGEGVWKEACAELDELDFTMTDAEFKAYQVGGFFELCNATLQDSVIDLAEEVAQALLKSIGKAVDRAVIEGNGITQPLGIKTRLEQQTEPSSYPPTARPWEDLTDHIVAVTGQGGSLYKAIVEAGGKATGKYSNSQRVWLMNADTLNTLKAEGISVGIVGGVTDKTGVIGGVIETLNTLPDNTIITGYFDDYVLAERKGMSVARSDHNKLLSNKTVFRGIGLYDGQPVVPEAFAVITFTVAPAPGPTPTGTLYISENGGFDATEYAEVAVTVEQMVADGDTVFFGAPEEWEYDRGVYYATVTGDLPLEDGMVNVTVVEVFGDEQEYSNAVYTEYGQVINGVYEGDNVTLTADGDDTSIAITYSEQGKQLVVVITEKGIEGGGGGDTLTELFDDTLESYTNSDATVINGHQFEGWGSTADLSFGAVTSIGAPNGKASGSGSSFAYYAGDIILPNVEYLNGASNFKNSGIKSVNWQNFKSKLESSTFEHCNSLKTVKIKSTNAAQPLNVEYGAFSTSSFLETVELETPSVTAQLSYSAFGSCSSLTKLILNSPNSSTGWTMAATNALQGTPIASGTGYVYVNDELVDTYKAATNWSVYADQIKGISELS